MGISFSRFKAKEGGYVVIVEEEDKCQSSYELV